MNRWKEYGQDLPCFPEGESQPTESEEPPEVPSPHTPGAISSREDIAPEPSQLLAEVENATQLLSNGKLPGLDNLPEELIKSSDVFWEKMHPYSL